MHFAGHGFYEPPAQTNSSSYPRPQIKTSKCIHLVCFLVVDFEIGSHGAEDVLDIST